MDLSKKIKEIRKFSQFGLVTLSPHALKRAKERGIVINDIYSMLCSSSSTICQFHHKYKNHIGPTYVIWSKLHKKYYHIVVGEEKSVSGAPIFIVLTVYVPSPKFFTKNGRFLKPLKERMS